MAFGLGPLDLVGIVGLLLLLGAFGMNTLGRWRSDSKIYLALNALGSALLALYSVGIRAWVFFPLEVFWALVALLGLGGVLSPRPHPPSLDPP